jgi:hypothetical protein
LITQLDLVIAVGERGKIGSALADAGCDGNDPVAQPTGPAERKKLKRKIRQPAAAHAPPPAHVRHEKIETDSSLSPTRAREC